MTIQLYHCQGARSLRAVWTLEEMGIDYDLHVLPFPPRVFKKDYLGTNLLGTVPYMIDGDVHMTESSGIAKYLVDRYGPTPLAVDVDDPDYGAYLNWLFYSDATLTFPQTLFLRYTRLEPEERRVPQVAEDYRRSGSSAGCGSSSRRPRTAATFCAAAGSRSPTSASATA